MEATARGSYLRALRHTDLRWLMSALAISAIGGWAYNVALYVYVYDRTHSAGWVGAATLGRFVPALLFSSYGGVIAERFERHAVMITSDVLCAAYMLGMGLAAAARAPALVVIVLAALTSVTSIVYPSATAAMVPQVVDEQDLAAANGINGGIDQLSMLLGPALGGLLLVPSSPSTVMWVNGATFVVSALLVARLSARSRPSDVTRDGGPLGQIMAGVRAITRSSTAALLVGFSVLASFMYGTDTVLFVMVSKEKLGTGATGYGYLLMAVGVGGVIGSTLVNRLAALPRLGLVITVGMVVYCVPTAALVAVHSPAVAFALEVVRGMGTLVVDVLAITALQRSLPSDMIARVFGVFFTLVLGAISLGALLAPIALRAIGLDATLLLAGLAVPALVAVAYPSTASIDRAARARLAELAPRVAALEQVGIFAAANRPTLERLAAAATEVVQTQAGRDVVVEGEPADALYVLVDGTVDVYARGEARRARKVRTMTAPAYFGEIGVIEHIARTATVRTSAPCRLLRIDGDDFLAALADSRPSPALADSMSRRLARTHPSYGPVHLPAQRDPAEEVVRT